MNICRCDCCRNKPTNKLTKGTVGRGQLINGGLYQTEAEVFGWSFVFEDLVSDELRNKATQKMQVREPRFAAEGMGVGPRQRILWDLGSPGPQ